MTDRASQYILIDRNDINAYLDGTADFDAVIHRDGVYEMNLNGKELFIATADCTYTFHFADEEGAEAWYRDFLNIILPVEE